MRRALLALLALGLLAGCGDDDAGGDGSAADRVAGAVRASASTTSFRMRFQLDSDLGGEEMTMEGIAVAATDNSRGTMEGRMGLGEPPSRFEMIQVGDDYFFRGPAFEQSLPPGKEWVRVPEGAPQTMDPKAFLEFLRDSPEVEEAGREEVRGEQTVHLRGPIDVAELVERADSEAAESFARFPQAARLRMEIDVWIGEADDRIWRIAMRMSHPDAEGEMRMRADVLEHDVPLDGIQTPPADDVAELGG